MRLGEYDFNEVSDTRRDFAVEKIFMHEGYERKTYTNDISLLKLTQKATFTNFIWPICLPPNNLVLEGQTASVTGISWFPFVLIAAELEPETFEQSEPARIL